jgi:ribosomal protein L37AE/L43A
MIGPQQPDKGKRKQWESAHVCPQCGFPIELQNIGLTETTTGLITCQKCDWSGQVMIEIIEKERRE